MESRSEAFHHNISIGPNLREHLAQTHEARLDVEWGRNARSPEAVGSKIDAQHALHWLQSNPNAPVSDRAAARRAYHEAHQANSKTVTGMSWSVQCPSCRSVWNPDYRDPQTGRKPARSSGNGIKHYKGCPEEGGPLSHEPMGKA